MLSLLAGFTLLASALAQANNPDSSVGKTLYVTAPSCTFFQCTITWRHGDTVSVNWLGPPQGQVSVSLASNIGGPTYTITPAIAAISQSGYCDAGSGAGVVVPGVECGMIRFVVPAGWTPSTNNTIVVQSLSTLAYVGYTDAVIIAASNGAVPGPAGTAVTLLTIPGPTSTNLLGSTVFAGVIPAPTALAGGAAPVATTSPILTSPTVVPTSATSSLVQTGGPGISDAARSSAALGAAAGTVSSNSGSVPAPSASSTPKTGAARGSGASAGIAILVGAGVWAGMML